MFSTGLSQAIIPIRAVILAALLLGDVNFLFLVHVAQEQQQGAGAKYDGQHEGNPTIHAPSAGIGVGYELIKFKDRATQSGHSYN
jgi:hypothetical protein